ncbi:hypothetical protein QTN25_002433 [Entamoeba marina]
MALQKKIYIYPIFKYGFRPTKRCFNGQIHGSGEYFSQKLEVSLQYCYGCNKIIICYILTYIGDKITFVDNSVNNRSIIAINNPSDENITYCFPLFVIEIPYQYDY